MKISNTLFLLMALLPMAATAQDKLELNYDGFFDRMKDLDEPEYQGVKLAFYLMDKAGQPCPVKGAKIATKLKSQDVYVLDTGEMLLPYEPLLDQDKALLIVDKKDDRECGLNMRLESSQLFENKVVKAQALELTDKFAAAFDDLGGMMSFMLPKVKGITFKFPEGVKPELTSSQLGKCDLVNGCTILKDDLATFNGDIEFNHKPIKALPFIQ